MPKNRHSIGKITPPSHHKKAAEPILIGCLGGDFCVQKCTLFFIFSLFFGENLAAQPLVACLSKKHHQFLPPHSLIHSVTLCPMRSLKATLKVL